MTRHLLTLLIAFTLISCTSVKVPEWSVPETVWKMRDQWACGNEDLMPWVDEWQAEIAYRYEEFFLIMVHGETLYGEWHVFPDRGGPVPVTALIARFRQRGVEGQIVLVVCNPGGHRLNVPDVSYATRNVWVVPDRYVNDLFWSMFRDLPEDGIGTIHEFTHNP